jgi:hypothetical protein
MAQKKPAIMFGEGAPGMPKKPGLALGSICPGSVPWGVAAIASSSWPATAWLLVNKTDAIATDNSSTVNSKNFLLMLSSRMLIVVVNNLADRYDTYDEQRSSIKINMLPFALNTFNLWIEKIAC